MAECLALIKRLKQAKILAVDTETNGEDIRDGRGYLTGISICARLDGELVADYFPFRHGTGSNLPDEVRYALRDLLGSGIPTIYHNAKFDLISLGTAGIRPTGQVYCTLLMAHLINENLFSYSLNSVCAFYLGKEAENQKDVSEELRNAIKTFGWANIPVAIMTPYATRDAVLLFRLAEKIWPLFTGENLMSYWQHKRDFIDVINAMESIGVMVDEDLCREQSAIGEARMDEITKELGGKPAGKYLEWLLLDKLNLPVYKVSEKTGKPSFDKFAMELYELDLERMDSDIAKLITEYRGWQKAVSSNYKPYVELRSPDNALRPNYKLHGTKTGRMSCEKPNLQQIPRVSDKPWNGKMKEAFIPREGYSLWEADYSQLELRLSTAYAKEQSLIEVFEQGRDIFTEMSEVLQMTRQDTKTFVYSTQYGAGVRRIKTALGVSETRARMIRENYFATYRGFRLISDRAQGMARNHGRVKVWSGRYRHFRRPDEESHKALNSIIQGGAADIVEKVMVRLYKEIHLPSSGECKMLLQVHDSVVFEIAEGKEDFYKDQIRKVMEDVDAITGGESFGVRFNVDIKKWADNG